MKNQQPNMDLLILREEIYNDFIQEYNDLTQDEISDLVDKEMEKYE
jgi:hypothetical protein